MKTQLIILPKHNIIVSDENINSNATSHGGLGYHTENNEVVVCDKDYYNPWTKKIIASDNPEHNWKEATGQICPLGLTDSDAYEPDLPSIDYNDLEEEFGIVDVDKLVKEFTNYGRGSDLYEGFIKGFKTHQSLNDKKFSLDDMKSVFNGGIVFGEEKGETKEESFNRVIQSLQQPKVFDIEVEMICALDCDKLVLNGENSICCGDKTPKITNNKIKIIKIC